MNRILTFAMDAASTLPENMQDEIGRAVLEHVRKLQDLRQEIQLGIDSIEGGRGRELTAKVWDELKATALKRAGIS